MLWLPVSSIDLRSFEVSPCCSQKQTHTVFNAKFPSLMVTMRQLSMYRVELLQYFCIAETQFNDVFFSSIVILPCAISYNTTTYYPSSGPTKHRTLGNISSESPQTFLSFSVFDTSSNEKVLFLMVLLCCVSQR